ncbi:hypothetical protein BTM25_38060 [Actinomadura rubteroloni]|uniref:DUF397 domain-containing protein n=1 Tax=Actinomadura rubteroloni TaxID=1926885 RepID=A0A2P4UJC7_9ACTN|nr:DUF397 domain-containing protein [Actinomadura rubteroloni]POM25163.1 hypothetical protein BTM25_38060 [Actinomadura rubteroloni]
MTPQWRKSTRSGGNNGGMTECVEVAKLPHTVGLRDSKAPAAGHLTLTPATFAALLTEAKRNDLNL